MFFLKEKFLILSSDILTSKAKIAPIKATPQITDKISITAITPGSNPSGAIGAMGKCNENI